MLACYYSHVGNICPCMCESQTSESKEKHSFTKRNDRHNDNQTTGERVKACVLPGGDAIPGGATVEVLSGSFEDGAVSTHLTEDHTSVDRGGTDGRVL